MNISPQTEERPGYPRQEIHQAAHRSEPHEGEPMMSKHTPTEPSADELCNIMSDLAGSKIETVDDLARFSYSIGVEPSEFFQTARMIAVIEAALQGGEK